MKIELWSDFACPFCYIGKTKFEQALSTFEHKDEVEVLYKAYQLNPSAPKVMEGNAEEAFAKGHGVSVKQAKAKFKLFVRAAKEVGLEYNYDIIQMTNSFDAHRIAKWARKYNKEMDITNRFMKAYFTEGKNLADQDTLVELSAEVGLSRKEAKSVLSSTQYKDIVEAEILEGRQVGVQGVPFFVLNRKYGISGAQPVEHFTRVLEQLWKETNPVEEIKVMSKGHTCDDEGCSI
jgi:predicted DsbA family dithiol-disulfide isomerase